MLLAYLDPGAESAGLSVAFLLVTIAIGVALLAAFVLTIRAIYGRSCPVCGKRVKRGLTSCPHCEANFAAGQPHEQPSP